MNSFAGTQEDLLRLVIEQSPDAVALCAPGGQVLYWSPGAEVVFGYRAEEAQGRLWSELVLPARAT